MENKWWKNLVPMLQNGEVTLHKQGRHPGSKPNGPKKLAKNRARAKVARASRKANR